MKLITETGSFRDKDGYIFYHEENVYRAISKSYSNTWEQLLNAQFFKELIAEKKLPSFEEVSLFQTSVPENYKVIKVEKIPFISYPTEWTFRQLKRAALLTLAIQKKALQNNFTLKDASAYNVQFIGSRAVFIDTLSFEEYTEGQPWYAYKQFCQHFLGPLLLWSYGFEDAKSLYLNHIDGIPLKLSASLLPLSSKFSLLAYTNIHLHARFENKHSEKKEIKKSSLNISKNRSLSIIEHLEQGIKKLKVKNRDTNWTGYYDTFSYSEPGYDAKKTFVEKHCALIKGNLCVDLGANTGEFSELAAKYFRQVIACDNDLEVVSAIAAKKHENILALHTDINNPGPAYGWNNNERKSFIERIKTADLTLSLALIHHLCIGNNVPLTKLAEFFAEASNSLIIEFVPKTDIQVKKLLVTKKDIFDDYTLENFKTSFSKYFSFIDSCEIPGSERKVFFLKKYAV